VDTQNKRISRSRCRDECDASLLSIWPPLNRWTSLRAPFRDIVYRRVVCLSLRSVNGRDSAWMVVVLALLHDPFSFLLGLLTRRPLAALFGRSPILPKNAVLARSPQSLRLSLCVGRTSKSTDMDSARSLCLVIPLFRSCSRVRGDEIPYATAVIAPPTASRAALTSPRLMA
jgi:hypothetical protein